MEARRVPGFRIPLASQCAICLGWDDDLLCRHCVQRFAPPLPRCPTCALPSPTGTACPDCLRAPPPFEHGIAALDYAWPWDRLIGDLKFRDGLGHCRALAALLAGAVRQAGAPPAELLLPMPLSPQRLRERGYNQAWELARRVGRTLGIPAEARLLRRLVDTPHQLSLPRAQRAANVRGVFGVDGGRAALLRGRRVALVDDVMTTGASAAEAARVLRDTGAAAVQVWVLTRTPRPQDA